MRRLALIVSLIGLCVLGGMFVFGGIVEVSGVDELEGLGINERVMVRGEVVSSRYLYDDFVLIGLAGGIEVVCEGCIVDIGERVVIEGIIEEYKGENQVRVLVIEEVN